ncbi:Type-1 restriction enzyme EcoKI specificity protein [Clavibacter michiganensis]|nr:Type-1 restriction enzyme EcoKI specificity protein [Clavibacter michiganensis]
MKAMRAYPAYRECDTGWCTRVPEHWRVEPISKLFVQRSVLVNDRDFPPLSVTREGLVPQLEGVAKTENGDARKLVRKGEFAINSRSDRKGSSGIADRDGSVAGITTVITPRGMDPGYVHYALRSQQFQEEYYRFGSGIVSDLWSTRWPAMKAIRVPVPPQVEQEAIASFLTREATSIDSSVRDQEELVRLLAERRAAAISHAVSRGFDSNASMRESGAAWFGEVPEHWTLTRFPFAVDYCEGPGIGAIDFREQGVPLLRVAGVRERFATLNGCNFLDPDMVLLRWRRFQINPKDLLVSASASMGMVSEASEEVVGAVPYTGIIRMAPRPGTYRDFLRFFLQSAAFVTQIDRLKTGSTIKHYGPEHLRQMYIALPPEPEQHAIAARLAQETSEIDAVNFDARAAIRLSREHRAALISAAVTGEIDLREAH